MGLLDPFMGLLGEGGGKDVMFHLASMLTGQGGDSRGLHLRPQVGGK